PPIYDIFSQVSPRYHQLAQYEFSSRNLLPSSSFFILCTSGRYVSSQKYQDLFSDSYKKTKLRYKGDGMITTKWKDQSIQLIAILSFLVFASGFAFGIKEILS